VRFTAEDAVKENFATIVIEDACRAIDMDNSAADARASFKKIGVTMLSSTDL